jgi:hypothetical protein
MCCMSRQMMPPCNVWNVLKVAGVHHVRITAAAGLLLFNFTNSTGHTALSTPMCITALCAGSHPGGMECRHHAANWHLPGALPAPAATSGQCRPISAYVSCLQCNDHFQCPVQHPTTTPFRQHEVAQQHIVVARLKNTTNMLTCCTPLICSLAAHHFSPLA